MVHKNSMLKQNAVKLNHFANISPLRMSTTTASSSTNKLWNFYVKATDICTTLFPVWTVLFAGLALKRPESFAWFTTKYFTASLGIHIN